MKSITKLFFLVMITTLSGCSMFRSKPLADLDLPKTQEEMQKIKKIGYFALCEGTLRTLDSKTNSQEIKSPCRISFTEDFGKQEVIDEAFLSALKKTFPKYTWVNLGPEIPKSSVFSSCYKSLLTFESLIFQKCLDDQETRKKIQEEFKVDAVAYLTAEVHGSTDETYGSRFLPHQMKDVEVTATIFYKLDLGVAHHEPLLFSVDERAENIPLNAYKLIGSVRMSQAKSSSPPSLLYVKTLEFLSTVHSKLKLN